LRKNSFLDVLSLKYKNNYFFISISTWFPLLTVSLTIIIIIIIITTTTTTTTTTLAILTTTTTIITYSCKIKEI